MSDIKNAETDAEEPKKGGKKKLIIIAVVVLALAGGGWWFFLKPSGEKEEAAPEPGEVLTIEPIQINLADDHYLKIGIALQATAEVHEELDGSKALDHTIDLFSGQSIQHLAQRKHRVELKKELQHRLEKAYHHEVMGVYFTDFVTQ